jgi:hypothetical protein
MGFVALSWSPARADIFIPTNSGGADAEVREEEFNLNGTGVPQGTNRGASNELAMRIKDATGNPTSDRSSAMYLKFNIASITQADLNLSVARLQLSIRNANITEARRNDYSPVFPNDEDHRVTMQFNLFGLTNFGVSNYDWAENQITWYNAPGITPDDPDGVSDGTDTSDVGKYNFNSDMTLLGQFTLPDVAPQNHLAVGSKVYYDDSSGLLRKLIQDAKNAGKTSITLAAGIALNGFDAVPPESETQQSTPQGMLNFNYLFNPKEMTTLLDDPGYDPDGGGIGSPTGSPFSCNGASSINCPGGTLGNNSSGAFSPTLILVSTGAVPEPAGMILAGLGAIGLATMRRRKGM